MSPFHNPYDSTVVDLLIVRTAHQRIMSNALSSWTNRVIELRARALTVTQDRNTRLLQGAFSRWLGKSRQNIENLSLVDSFIDVQEEELLRSRFRKWHASAKRKAYLRQLLLEKLEDDERNLVAGVFDRWVDVYKERQLIDQVSKDRVAAHQCVICEAQIAHSLISRRKWI